LEGNNWKEMFPENVFESFRKYLGENYVSGECSGKCLRENYVSEECF